MQTLYPDILLEDLKIYITNLNCSIIAPINAHYTIWTSHKGIGREIEFYNKSWILHMNISISALYC